MVTHQAQSQFPPPLNYYNSQSQLNVQTIPAQHLGQAHAPVIVNQMQQPYFRSQEVCCATARTWCQVIAWMRIIGCGLGVIGSIILLALYGKVRDFYQSAEYSVQVFSEKIQTLVKDPHVGNAEDVMSLSETVNKIVLAYLIMCIILLILTGAGFIAGVVLQQGVSQRKPGFLTIWIVFELLTVVLCIACAVAISVLVNAYNAQSSYFVGNIVGNILCIWVVVKHRSELEDFKTSLQFFNSQSLHSAAATLPRA